MLVFLRRARIVFCCAVALLFSADISFAEAKEFKPLTLNDVTTIDSAAYTKLVGKAKGKVVVVNIFASWCPPCKAEIPWLIEARAAFPESEVLFIGISVDAAHDEMVNFVNDLQVTYPVYIATGDFVAKVGVSAIPQLMIYNASGGLEENHVGLMEQEVLMKTLHNLLGRDLI